MAMKPEQWLHFICEQLGKEWTDLPAVRQMSQNNDLYGAYIEGSVRQFITRFVSPLRISKGTIVYEDNIGEMSPQLDAVIWHPSPLPAIVEVGEFAIVPRLAGLAYLEIKSSNYNGVGKSIESKLSLMDNLVPKLERLPSTIQDSAALNDRALGVVCVHTPGIKDEVLDRLISEKRVAVMVRRLEKTSDITVDSSGIVRLAKFLTHVRYRAKNLDGVFAIRDPNEMSAAMQDDGSTMSGPVG
jgi:hypothetical protein